MNKLLDRLNPLRTHLGVGDRSEIWRAAVLIVFAIAVLGVLADIKNTAKFGQIDLRNRVVGARVMLLEQNPYGYFWQPGEPDTLLDPFPITQKRLRSAVTVTPTVLSLHALFVDLPYRAQKFLWLFVQVALFSGLIWLAMARAGNPETRGLVLLLGLMFSCSTFWRLHVERGQAYVLFAFVAVLYIVSLGRRTTQLGRDLLAGFVLGVLACLRPQLALLGLPLLVYRKWRMILGVVVGLGAGLLLPSLISKSVWPDYVQSMMSYTLPNARPISVGAGHQLPELPAVVEGSSNLASFAQFGSGDTSLKKFLSFYLRTRLPAPLIFGLMIAGILAWFFQSYRLMRQAVPLDFCTTQTLGLVLFIETILPITRDEYSNMILVPVVVMIFALRGGVAAMRTWEWSLLLAAWLFTAPFPPWISAGHRGPLFAMFSQCAIMIWAVLVPWTQPAAIAVADEKDS